MSWLHLVGGRWIFRKRGGGGGFKEAGVASGGVVIPYL